MGYQRDCSNLTPGAKYQVMRLFTTLEYGEQLAHHCAREQASLVDDIKHSRFLRLQSRQEAFHAKFFRNAAKLLGRGKTSVVPHSLSLFSSKIEGALQRKDLTETLVGQQIVLETFGGAVLYHLNRGLDNCGIGLRTLRSMVLEQELSHNQFGDDLLRKQLATKRTTIDKIQSLSSEYLILVDMIIDEMSDVFICLEEDPGEYRNYIYSNLPQW